MLSLMYGKSASLMYGKASELEDGTTRPDECWNETTKSSQPSAWIGPKHIGCCVIEIHGPLQLLFMFLAVTAVGFLIAEFLREDGGLDAVRTISGMLFIFVCIYLTYLGKALYIVKAFRREIVEYKVLNRRFKGEVVGMAIQNQSYIEHNFEHRKLNTELSEKVGDLTNLEQQFSMLSTECNGSVVQATQLIERIERNTKLNTSNLVHLFFGHADKNQNGRIDAEEVDSFVESLRFFSSYFATFKPEALKAAILEQGGLSLDQVQKLVDSMLPDGELEEQEDADAVAVTTPRNTA
mmetsp:Transcript_102652/g.203782  ORF Transcript_102652/g.203782 Transcript_102652/m.203782 type:complete len:295 (-) Transcript_102652:58-942(-)